MSDKSAPPPLPTQRLVSLDAYRGFMMLMMASEAFYLSRVAKQFKDSSLWQAVAYQADHVAWTGCAIWDLIQPSFMFMVGVSMPYSLASRRAKGDRFGTLFGHAIWRAILLIALGILLRSVGGKQTNYTFVDVLTQIGLGYPFLFLIAWLKPRAQFASALAILIGYWAAFALYPLPPEGFDYKSVGVPQNWPHLTGFAAHWDKNTNFAFAVDQWFMNLFPRVKAFTANGGGYSTLSFIPTLGTMILGLIAGTVLRSDRDSAAKIRWLAVAGAACLFGGAALGWLGIVPVVKRIWTPSWVLYSGGWCFLLLGLFYWAIDFRQNRRWSFALVVIGANSIAAYLIAHLFDAFIARNLVTHLGTGPFRWFGAAYEPLVHGFATLLLMWLLLYWMWRRKLFLKI